MQEFQNFVKMLQSHVPTLFLKFLHCIRLVWLDAIAPLYTTICDEVILPKNATIGFMQIVIEFVQFAKAQGLHHLGLVSSSNKSL